MFLTHLLHYGFQKVLGIEPSKTAINTAPDYIRPYLHQTMFSPQCITGRTASRICALMVLEHLIDHKKFIYNTFDMLESRGVLAIITHNYNSLLNRNLGKRASIIDIEHLQLFCSDTIKILMNKVGFINIRITPLTNTSPLHYWLKLMPLPSFIKKYIVTKGYSLNKVNKLSKLKLSFNVGNILTICIKS